MTSAVLPRVAAHKAGGENDVGAKKGRLRKVCCKEAGKKYTVSENRSDSTLRPIPALKGADSFAGDVTRQRWGRGAGVSAGLLAVDFAAVATTAPGPVAVICDGWPQFFSDDFLSGSAAARDPVGLAWSDVRRSRYAGCCFGTSGLALDADYSCAPQFTARRRGSFRAQASRVTTRPGPSLSPCQAQ